MENILLLQDEENADLLDKVLTIYLEHSGELVQDLFRAAEQKMPGDLKRLAHSLKSASRNVGAVRFSELCREIETAASGDLNGALGAVMADFRLQYQSVRSALEGILENGLQGR